jgi:hypothetical protein
VVPADKNEDKTLPFRAFLCEDLPEMHDRSGTKAASYESSGITPKLGLYLQIQPLRSKISPTSLRRFQATGYIFF